MLNAIKEDKIRMTIQILFVLSLASFSTVSYVQAGVIEIDGKFMDYVKQDPNRGWLVKFYAPWCHHCKNLEPTYTNVAEAIYHKHDNLLVARVDCTKHTAIAKEFSIESFPTIMFIKGNDRINYHGERTVDDIVSFADRLHGPRVRIIDSCQDLRGQINSRQVIILSTIRDRSDLLYKNYTMVAENYSTNFWFFETNIAECKGIFSSEDKKSGDIYILKLNKPKPISYLSKSNSDASLSNWIKHNTFPIFAKLGSSDLSRGLKANRLMIVAILDEYQTMKRMTMPNSMFREVMKDLARDYAENESFQFGWSSDLSALNSIAIKTINTVPNLIVLAANLSYYMPEDIPIVPSNARQLPQHLTKQTIKKFLEEIEQGKLIHKIAGGDSFYYRTTRNIYNTYSFFSKIFNGEPMLILLLLCLPAACLFVIIYTTCCGNSYSTDDDDDVPFVNGDHEKED